MLFLFSLLLKNSRQLFVGYNSASSVSKKWKLCSLCSTLAEFDLLEALCNVKLPIACGQMRPNILPGNSSMRSLIKQNLALFSGQKLKNC